MAFTDDHRRLIQDLPGGEERAPAGAGTPRRRGPGGGPRPGGGRPGGDSTRQTEAKPAQPAEVAAKPADDKATAVETPKAPEDAKPAGGESGRSSGKAP
jgi:hypothetical protein